MKILSTRERWKSTRNKSTFLKGQCKKFHWQPLTLGSVGGRVKLTTLCEERLGFVALERELMDSCQDL